MDVPVGMDPTYYVNFGDAGQGMILGHLYQIANAHFPASFLSFFSAIGAESTVIDTDIRWFKMDISVKEHLLSVDPVSNMVGQNCQIGQGGFLEKQNSFVRGNSLTRNNLFCDPDQRLG